MFAEVKISQAFDTIRKEKHFENNPLMEKLLYRILINILQEPNELKYQRLLMTNSVIKQAVSTSGVAELLTNIGFTRIEGDYLVTNNDASVSSQDFLTNVSFAIDLLKESGRVSSSATSSLRSTTSTTASRDSSSTTSSTVSEAEFAKMFYALQPFGALKDSLPIVTCSSKPDVFVASRLINVSGISLLHLSTYSECLTVLSTAAFPMKPKFMKPTVSSSNSYSWDMYTVIIEKPQPPTKRIGLQFDCYENVSERLKDFKPRPVTALLKEKSSSPPSAESLKRSTSSPIVEKNLPVPSLKRSTSTLSSADTSTAAVLKRASTFEDRSSEFTSRQSIKITTPEFKTTLSYEKPCTNRLSIQRMESNCSTVSCSSRDSLLSENGSSSLLLDIEEEKEEEIISSSNSIRDDLEVLTSSFESMNADLLLPPSLESLETADDDEISQEVSFIENTDTDNAEFLKEMKKCLSSNVTGDQIMEVVQSLEERDAITIREKLVFTLASQRLDALTRALGKATARLDTAAARTTTTENRNC